MVEWLTGWCPGLESCGPGLKSCSGSYIELFLCSLNSTS